MEFDISSRMHSKFGYLDYEFYTSLSMHSKFVGCDILAQQEMNSSVFSSCYFSSLIKKKDDEWF